MSERIQKINELIRHVVSEAILKEVEVPQNSLITVTKVETTPDIKSSKILVSVLPDKYRGTALEVLRKKNHIFHLYLKKRLKTKFTPNLKFEIDNQEVFANEVEKILDELNRK